MSLRLRRGTDAERAAVVFDTGELVYTTDTKQVYIGDASTPGGILLSSNQVPAELSQNLDLNSNDITGTGNISISGIVQADQFNGSLVGDVVGSVFADDSTIIVNGQTGVVTASLVGDVIGSVFGDDSTVLVDGANNKINLDGTVNGDITTRLTDNFPRILLSRDSASDISSDDETYGSIQFKRNDSGGSATASLISGGNGFMLFATSTSGILNADKFIAMSEGSMSIGGFTPTARLDVRGDIKAESSISPGIYADNSARDTAIPAPTAGMMVFNTTGTKFQGYTGSAWVDLN